MPHKHSLKEGVYLVRGASRGAILDTNTGNVYSINLKAVSVLTGETEDTAYWRQLASQQLAKASDELTNSTSLPLMAEPRLSFIWFEINTSDCNERCLHCYADSMPASERGRRSLPLYQQQKRKLSFDEWCNLINEGFQLGCQNCQFIGGEPLLYKDGGRSVLDLAECARIVGYKDIEIYTNAALLTNAKIQRIKKLGLHIAVSLYSYDPRIHDEITQTPGSHAKTVSSLRLLKKHQVPTRVEVIALRNNEETIPQTMQFIEDLGFPVGRPDPLRPKGRGDNPGIMPSLPTLVQYGVMTEPRFLADKQTIAHYASAHSCLAGKITITETGDILPCIFSRNKIMGNVVTSGGMKQIIEGPKLQKVWKTTKDDVLVCKDCEYRYVCFDCRPLSESSSDGFANYFDAPYPRCSYNPYTGEWAKGLWRMTEHGPTYDRSYELVMKNLPSEKGNINSAVRH